MSNEHNQSSASVHEAGPAARIMELIGGGRVAQVTRAAAHFRLAEVLGDVPMSAADVARRIAVSPDATQRLLRACVHIGLASFSGGYVATPLLAQLKDAPGSMRSFALSATGPAFWQPWARLVEALETGEPQVVPALGMGLWEYFAKNPAEAAEFSAGMSGITATVVNEVVRGVDFSGARSVADIGGAAGALLFAVLAAHAHLHGILHDRPNIAATAQAPAAVRDRFTAVGGDFLESVPTADVYLIKHILHDWDDAACIRILQSCVRAMPADGRVIVIEIPLGDESAPGSSVLMDLTMMLVLGARERTLPEYGELFGAAGLQLVRATPVGSGFMALEATLAR